MDKMTLGINFTRLVIIILTLTFFGFLRSLLKSYRPMAGKEKLFYFKIRFTKCQTRFQLIFLFLIITGCKF